MKRRQSSARLFYIVMCAGTFVLALFVGGTIPYGSAAVMILTYPVACFLSWIPGRQFTVRHALDRDVCPRGTEVRYLFGVANRGIVPAAWTRFEIESTYEIPGKPDAFETPIAPFKSFTWETSFAPPHRGIHTLKLADLRVTDPFCLVTNKLTKRKDLPDPLTLTVLPRLIPLPDSWKERLDPRGAGGPFAQSSDEPAVDSRQYRYGDSPRRIHWKLTARQRELMVRQYESEEKRRLLVILDLRPFKHEKAESAEDVLIEACLSVVCFALERQIDTTLLYAQGPDILRFTGRDSRFFEHLLRDMATVKFNSSVDLPDLLAKSDGAQMLSLFGAEMPDTLSVLPQDIPAELAVLRGFEGAYDPTQLIRVTVLPV
ncbi:MAG: DUF58 domain-containing protein [Oscillospiraceae bacterium]|jgi:uncharacterized protein (DUF58 family)|nr:DUF58 domain-containing protein [Oscillospiraceae bacterium]